MFPRFIAAEYFPSFEFVSGATPLSSIAKDDEFPDGSVTKHFTLLIGEPSFVFTITEAFRFMTGADDVVRTVSLDWNCPVIIGADIEGSITVLSSFSQEENTKTAATKKNAVFNFPKFKAALIVLTVNLYKGRLSFDKI